MRKIPVLRLGDATVAGLLHLDSQSVLFAAEDGTTTTFVRDDAFEVTVDGSMVSLHGTHAEGHFIAPATNDEVQRRRWAQSLANDLLGSAHNINTASVDVSFDDFAKSMNQTRSTQSKKMWMFLSAAAFFALSGPGSLQTLIALSAVLILHELGHLLAMKVFGYRDLAVFFLPFVGAVATGRAVGVRAWKRSVILLAGPLPGLALAWVLVLWAPANWKAQPWFTSFSGMLLIVNLFNLLPFTPLDGGRFISLLLLPKSPRAETAVSVVSGLLLMAVFGMAREWALMVVAALFVWGSFLNRKTALEALALRPHFEGASATFAELPMELQQRLFAHASRLAVVNSDPSREPQPGASLKRATRIARELLDRATADRPRLRSRAILLAIYVLTLAVTLAPIAVVLGRR